MSNNLSPVIKLYYLLKPYIPRRVRYHLHRYSIFIKRWYNRNSWPIDEQSARVPRNWQGWPEGKKFALVLTHDVETTVGYEKYYRIAELEKELGFRSCFNFVPEGYPISIDLLNRLKKEGFEVGMHGLNHDGKLYFSRNIFQERAVKINRYLKDWQAVGFRSPAMHHNLEWLLDLNIEYDASTFDTDPFEPQSDGIRTIFPFWVNGKSENTGYVELPYTLPQDSTLYLFMKETDIDIMKRKIDWIAQKGGMILFITHPDYVVFDNEKKSQHLYPLEYYKKTLCYIKDKYHNQYWHVLPRELARFWKKNYKGVLLKNT